MGTQGVVSVTEYRGVVLKVVAGCNGYNAKKLADRIASARTVDIDAVYQMAFEESFGSPESLVVMNKDTERFDGDGDLGPLYRQTFQNPWFNPRWGYGTAEYFYCVDLSERRVIEFVDPRYIGTD